MFRSIIMVGLLILVGLFAYYFFTGSQSGDFQTRAQSAAQRVGEKVLDEGVATAVYGQLMARYGRETLRFVHVHHENGRVLLYGLLPSSVNADSLRTDAAKVPGVSSVQVLFQPRPEADLTESGRLESGSAP